MKLHLLKRLAVPALLLLASAGCSTIKSWFPDKERDYQFTAEIPELIVPDDLKAGGLAMPMIRSSAQEPMQSVQVAETAASGEGAAEAIESASDTGNNEEKTAETASAPSSRTAGSSLQIDQSRNQAARIVARAMSRQRLEIVERNIDKGYFYVKYDPNAVQAQDETILDELNFMFGDDPSQEVEYRVSLQEINPQMTEVTVQDSEGKTLSNAPANALLKLITDGINNDIPQSDTPASQENKPAAESETSGEEAKPADASENDEQKAESSVQPDNSTADSKPADTTEDSAQQAPAPEPAGQQQ